MISTRPPTVHLVAQGFSQRPGKDFDQTYCHVLDITSFKYLLAFVIHFDLEIFSHRCCNYVLVWQPRHTPVYFTPSRFSLEVAYPLTREIPRPEDLQGFLRSKASWQNVVSSPPRLFISYGFLHDPALPCIFNLSQNTEYLIMAIYVDDLNLIGSPSLCKHAETLFTAQFDMKLLGKTSFCLGLHIQHFPDGVLLHHQTCTCKLLKHFQMN